MKENAVIFKKKERKKESLSFKQIVFEALKTLTCLVPPQTRRSLTDA